MRDVTRALMLALEAIRANVLRSGLTLLGIGIGVTVVIAVATVIAGANRYVADKIASLGSGVFSIQKASIAGLGDFDAFLKAMRTNPDLTLADFQAIRAQTTNAEYVAAQDTVSGAIQFGSLSVDPLTINGVTSDMQYLSSVEIASGRFITLQDENGHRAVAVLGADVASGLFPVLDPIGREVRIDGSPYEVVGVARPIGAVLGRSQDNFVILPLSTFSKMYGTNRSLTITVKGRPGTQRSELQDQARVVLRTRHHLAYSAPDDFALLTDEATEGFFGQILSVVSGIAIPVTMIALVVGGIVVMNIMLVTVTERTREIGIRKSVGARRRDILLQFLCESTLLSMAGGAAGVAAGYALSKGLSMAFSLPADFPYTWSAVAIALSAAVGLFFGTYPANAASRLDPIEALRSE